MAKDAEDNYIFARGHMASARLTGQHDWQVKRNGWLLHPRLEQHILQTKNPKIADVGCGNGIWTIDVSRKYPQASVTGLDISNEQFPPGWTVSKNVSFGITDLFSLVPDRWVGQFDVIHLRLVRFAAYGIGPSEIKLAFANLFKMLKPGGYIQWQEVEWKVMHQFQGNLDIMNPNDFTEWYQKIDTAFGDHLGKWKGYDWLADCKSVGFKDCEMIPSPILPEFLKIETDYVVWSITDLINKGLALKLGEGKEELLKSARQELDSFLARGGLYCYANSVLIARKES